MLACLAHLIVVALNHADVLHLNRAGNVTISQCGTDSFLSEPVAAREERPELLGNVRRRWPRMH